MANSPPRPLMADAYTISGHSIASPSAIERSVYNLTFRRSPKVAWPTIALDNRMVLYGVGDFLEEFLSEKLEEEEVLDSFHFMWTAHSMGGELDFNPDPWWRAIDEFDGHFPITIESLPDGSTFWPGELVVQVTSLDAGFGEMAATIEAVFLGMVACATARATVTRHLLERMRREVRRNYSHYTLEQIDGIARFMVHDFGMRASSTPLESRIFGRAHLLSFHGTDTFGAAWEARNSGGVHPTGTSILAHAHRIILGYDDEGEAVRALAEAADLCGDVAIASYLADTFDFDLFLDKLAVPLALEFQRRGHGMVVVRPDSGDGCEAIQRIIDRALENSLYTRDHAGRPVANHLRFIYGDSVNPDKINQILSLLRSNGLNSVGWGIFGIGGWLRAQGNRDVLSAAYKLSARGWDDIPVMKLSSTPEKMSVPGPNSLLRYHDEPLLHNNLPSVIMKKDDKNSALRTVYDGSRGGIQQIDGFMECQKRAIEEFDGFCGVYGNYGDPENPVLHRDILEMQRALIAKYAK